MLGRGAHLIHESQCPVHIIMERSTGKTMCCFVEFEDHKSAQATVDHVNASCDSHVGPRMGNRHVDVSISSQKELMEALFPMARCLVWANDRFASRGTRPDEWWSAGFKGFLTDEELFCVLRHAKEPHRVSGIAPISNSSKIDKYLRARLPARYLNGFSNRS